jgi:beta-glucosidase
VPKPIAPPPATPVAAASAEETPEAAATGTIPIPEVANTSSPESAGIHSANFRFPDGFLWGAATSAHQVEGNNIHNDWWAWEQAGKVEHKSGVAADHYHRFREDFDLAKHLGHNAHRFSLEWSRIEPEDGVFSQEAIDHYRDVLLALRERGMEPVVTLFHYTLPQWMAAKGGWESDEIEARYSLYVMRVLDEYKELARWWITLNEPVVQVFKGWLLGQWPPGKHEDYPTAFKVVRRMLRSHVKAYHLIHQRRPGAMVGVAKHVLALTACNPRSWSDRMSVRAREYLFNQLFIDALIKGTLRVPGLFWERLPSGRTLDFIGLNYYTRDFVKNTGLDVPGLLGNVCTLEHHQHIGKRNALGWEVYPEGLAHFLRTFAKYKLPILITENGIPAAHDDDRWVFIFMHLWQVARAISDDVQVVGYLYWSLLDNFEWADGYSARFGLIGVDYATQKRTVHPSARMMAQIIRRNEL